MGKGNYCEAPGLYDCRGRGRWGFLVGMFAPAIQDLAKPQWLAAIQTLKMSGGMPITQLAEKLGVSYMAAKQYGEDLTKLGYLERIRTPRTAVGRPEIFYRAAAKADSLFPDLGMAFSMELLENSRLLFGENAPERLIYQHFESLRARWSIELQSLTSPIERVKKLAALRSTTGVVCKFEIGDSPCPRLIELHHPLMALFRKYPRAVIIDTRMIEELLKTRVERIESGSNQTTIEYLLPDLQG
jgi:predicted ArsR family transcriptional regulator